MSTEEKISVIIPQYKTEWFIRLCLRSLRKYSKGAIQVIVVDNNSQDGSLEYLRGVPWIELIENQNASPGVAGHREALDMGVERASGEWICLFHSDTIVIKPGWDLHLLKILDEKGAVGLSTVHSYANRFDGLYNRCKRRLHEVRTAIMHPERARSAHVRSFCFFIKRDFLKKSRHKFSDEGFEVGHEFYLRHIAGRRPFVLLGRREMESLLWHTNETTSILIGHIKDERKCRKFRARMATLDNVRINDVLSDASLDA